jgi:hypothetical protein
VLLVWFVIVEVSSEVVAIFREACNRPVWNFYRIKFSEFVAMLISSLKVMTNRLVKSELALISLIASLNLIIGLVVALANRKPMIKSTKSKETVIMIEIFTWLRSFVNFSVSAPVFL